jgi:hypothetical protein
MTKLIIFIYLGLLSVRWIRTVGNGYLGREENGARSLFEFWPWFIDYRFPIGNLPPSPVGRWGQKLKGSGGAHYLRYAGESKKCHNTIHVVGFRDVLEIWEAEVRMKAGKATSRTIVPRT